MSFLIVTGMSGAGKSTVMDVLEDIGFFCVDNLPPELLDKIYQLNKDATGYARNMAVAIDARSKDSFYELSENISRLDSEGYNYNILFIDADNTTIFNRYKEHRRKTHPLIGEEITYLGGAIEKEREILEGLRQRSDVIIDTTHLSVNQLRDYIVQQYSAHKDTTGMTLQIISFGFKRGIPMDADFVFDVRNLPNPYYVEELRPRTGLEEDVSSYVMASAESGIYLDKIIDLIEYVYPQFKKEGKSSMVVAIGCTGGMHRSVALVHAIAKHFREKDMPTVEIHRDKDKAYI